MLHTKTITSTATTAPGRSPSSCAFKAPPRPKGTAYKIRMHAPRTVDVVVARFYNTQLLSNVKPGDAAAIAWQPVIPNCKLSTINSTEK